MVLQSSKEWEDIHDYAPSDPSAEINEDVYDRVASEKLEK